MHNRSLKVAVQGLVYAYLFMYSCHKLVWSHEVIVVHEMQQLTEDLEEYTVARSLGSATVISGFRIW
jgi:hypothetical protein